MKFREIMLKICMSSIFSGSIILLIFFNTLVLALDKYPQDDSVNSTFDMINGILTWLFFGEMIVKLSALGFKGYARDKVNLFDAFIVMLTIAENIMDLVVSDSGISSGGAISGFRAVRLFRIFKLARQLKSFQSMLNKITMSLKDIGNFSVLLFLFLFTFTLLGMEMFSHKAKFDENGDVDLENGESPRPNFDYFLNAFVTIFIVLIGDGWNNIMYQYWIAVGSYASIFFIILQIFGKYVLLNLFLAILLENFEEIDEEKDTNIEGNETPKKSIFTTLKLKIVSMV
jgi:hypothetical protein